RWTAEDPARRSAVSLRTIRRAELAELETSLTSPNDLAIRRALEAAGVEFIDENGGGHGVRLRKQHAACIAGNRTQQMGRSRSGLSTKIHAVVDGKGLPVMLGITSGEAHDNRLCAALLSGLRPQALLLADRGYDADWIGGFVAQQGAWANIPPKRN